jgi:Zn-dependent metalloprotease
MATKRPFALTLLSALLISGSLRAESKQDRAVLVSQRVMNLRTRLGLDEQYGFRFAKMHTDSLGQTHSRFQQTYRGVKVFGGDLIHHADVEGGDLPITESLYKSISLNVTPSLEAGEALAMAHRALAPSGSYVVQPKSELVIYPETILVRKPGTTGENALNFEPKVLRYRLAYHVHTELENGVDETAHTDYMVDAHSGALIKQWSTLHTTASTGTGRSQYNGTVNLAANSIGGGYELRDVARGMSYATYDLNHGTSGTGSIFTDPDNTWGDGANYNGGSTTSDNGQTAAVDAHFGIGTSYDYYKNVLGRNGIDGTNRATYNRVHYRNNYDNAFWSDTCFCMTYGDGSSFKSLNSIDVVGHEMTHGVTANSVPGGLTYSGESGGLNESQSDIHGTMVEFYNFGGGEASGSSTVPNSGGNWTIGEQLAAAPLRYMYKPSLDGASPDAYYSGIGSLDVHFSSGPSNRMFYFLSQGATTSGDTSSIYLPGGMSGIGNDHAARISYRALTGYYVSNESYAQAREAYIQAAKDLYGAGSAEEAATWNAFAAINVGSAYPTNGKLGLLRYYNGGNGQHFYTTSPAEIGGGNYGYVPEGTMGYVFVAQQAGTVPFYRYYNSNFGGHFYTTNFGELGSGGSGGWIFEGVQCYIQSANVAGSSPLYRYWNSANNDHFYTTNFNELGNGQGDYIYEGVAGYVMDSNN